MKKILENIISLLKIKRIYFILYFIFFIITLFTILLFGKEDIHIFLNQFHSPFFDNVFKYLTYAGDALVFIAFLIILLFIKFKYFYISLSSGILCMLLVNYFKRILAHNNYRPYFWFSYYYKGDHQIRFIEGVEMHGYMSFPSGHTTTAFLLFTLLTLFTKNKYFQILFFILAFFISYSRIYLSQHFLIDVFAGSIIGVSFSIIAFLIINQFKYNHLNKNILNIFRHD